MKNKYAEIQNTPKNIDTEDWRNLVFSNPSATIRIGTSFSGIGAIEHAFKQLGLNTKIMFAGDIDDNCKKAYFANYDIDESRWHTDVHNFDAKQYKDQIDLFVGGAPCQAFSLRGKHGGFEDTRGTLFREFARIVMECRPKIFIFENVKGMLSHDKGRTWNTIKETFENSCNYQIYFQVLNGKDYGIPQSRDRLFCIGFRNETDFKYPKPIPLTSSIYNYLDNGCELAFLLKEKGVRFVTRNINHIKSYTQINGDVMLCQKRNQQFNWHGDFVFHPKLKNTKEIDLDADYLFKVSDFEESYFLDKNPEHYAVVLTSDRLRRELNVSLSEIEDGKGYFRKLTPRECLRLMGFDDSFKIVVSNTETYKQAGNSIIVNVLKALLKQIDITKYAE